MFEGSELLVRSPFPRHQQQQQFPEQKSTFIYDGTFRLTRAGKMRVCAWPVGGSYESDRIFAIYYVDNPENEASSRGWTVEKAPATTVTHPLTSFVPFSFELSASQRYLARKRQNHLLPGQSVGNSNTSNTTNIEILPAQMVMTWSYDRQVQQVETKRRQQQRLYQQQQMNPQPNFSPTSSARRNRSSILPAAYQVGSSSLSSPTNSKSPTVSFILNNNNNETSIGSTHNNFNNNSNIHNSLPHGLEELPRSNNYNNNNNSAPDDDNNNHESDDVSIVPRFSAPAIIKAEVTTSWEWTKGIRWSYDFGETAEERYCIRVDRDCGFTKVRGIHGEWDAIVTTESALSVPVQFDVTPLKAVNTVFGIHDEETRIGHFQQWKELDCSLHLASSSAIGEEPEIMFRFFSHHPRHHLQQQLKNPLFEGAIAVGSTLSMRILPDSNAPGALLLQYSSEFVSPAGNQNQNNSNNKPTPKFCEVQLFLDGFFLTSAFFPQKSQIRASCLLSDPMMNSPSVQIVPRAPKTNLKVSNVFFGAAPLRTPLEDRRLILQKHIARDLEMAKASNYHSDLAHADPTCSVLFVELKIDISEIDSVNSTGGTSQNNNILSISSSPSRGGMTSSSSIAYVPLHLYWRPSWIERLPQWSVKCLGTATQVLMKLFSLESGRGVENFEEAEEKSKQSALIMQM